MNINPINQKNGSEKPFVLPVCIRLPIAATLFLAGIIIAFRTALQSTDTPPILVPEFATTMLNVMKGIMWALAFTVSAVMFNTVFRPSAAADGADKASSN